MKQLELNFNGKCESILYSRECNNNIEYKYEFKRFGEEEIETLFLCKECMLKAEQFKRDVPLHRMVKL